MTTDAKFTSLEITESILAKTIDVDNLRVKTLTLDDQHIKTHIDATSGRIKELYEMNRNTQSLSDDNKVLVESLQKTTEVREDAYKITVNGPFTVTSTKGQFFNIPDEVDYADIPEGHGVWCFSGKYGMIMKFKRNGKSYFTHGNTYEWSLPVSVTVDDTDTVKVKIDTI